MLNARVVSKEPAYGPADTWNGFKFKEKPDGCIDYIFVSDDRRISITKFATLTDSYDMKYPSDHMPVLAVFLLKNNHKYFEDEIYLIARAFVFLETNAQQKLIVTR